LSPSEGERERAWHVIGRTMFLPLPSEEKGRGEGLNNAVKALFSGQGDFAGAGELEDAEGLHQVQKFFDFALVAGDFDGEALRLDIDDFGAENVGDLHDLGPGLRTDAHFDEDQLAVDV